jgi:pyruvate/2-oxoglutarate dehydrogenase complex dihydrolipoamide dehydrogenase (E3) component
VELAQLFARMDVAVTINCRSRLLPAAEPEVAAALSQYFKDEGIRLNCGVAYQLVKRTKGGISLKVKLERRDEIIEAEQLLVATGRNPNVEELGLKEAEVTQSTDGSIAVDEFMRTSRTGVYAAGDVTGRDQFVYMAAYGAKIAARNALGSDTQRYDRTVTPAVVFTDPQVSSVGLTEEAATSAGYEVRTSVLPLGAVPRAIVARDTRGLIKLVADAKTRRLIGAQVLAPEGADTIQTAALAIRQGLTINDLAEMIFPYLTTVEGLKLAAQAFDKDVAKLSCCAG